MSVQEMEEKLVKLQNKKLRIVSKLERGIIDEESCQELYEPVSIEYNKLYKECEKAKSQQYDVFISSLGVIR